MTNNSALVFDRSDNIAVANAISGSGTVTMAGSGSLTLTGSNSYSGPTVISSGILYVEMAAPSAPPPPVSSARMVDNSTSPSMWTS